MKNLKPGESKRLAWGAAEIGKKINRSAEQTRYLLRSGALGDAVKKVGHRTWVGDCDRLEQFPQTDDAA
jgi:hypothetical protein